MQLTIGDRKYTFVFTVAATLCDELIESVMGIAKASSGSEEDASYTIGGKLPVITKSLFYGGLLQMHENEIRSKKDSDRLLKQYMTENDGKREGTLYYIFNALWKQVGEDNFLSRIGIGDEVEDEKVTPISKGRKSADGGEN